MLCRFECLRHFHIVPPCDFTLADTVWEGCARTAKIQLLVYEQMCMRPSFSQKQTEQLKASELTMTIDIEQLKSTNLSVVRQKKVLPVDYVLTEFDICNGRGKSNWSNPGNMWFRSIVKEHESDYAGADRDSKSLITRNILLAVRELGGQFLKLNRNKQWYDIGDIAAREKISHSLRDQVLKSRRSVSQEDAFDFSKMKAASISKNKRRREAREQGPQQTASFPIDIIIPPFPCSLQEEPRKSITRCVSIESVDEAGPSKRMKIDDIISDSVDPISLCSLRRLSSQGPEHTLSLAPPPLVEGLSSFLEDIEGEFQPALSDDAIHFEENIFSVNQVSV